ncbi:unnamed protein product [Gordionus sp. m RMFG-2023]|uniref:uncharacterized protein LOC135929810 n=1 Tax=Gordionus sp. m RMFG-2023 TaxID=3053472 RepID=UPI0030E5EF8E
MDQDIKSLLECIISEIELNNMKDLLTSSKRRRRHVFNWKQNIRKYLCQSGKSYVDYKGVYKPERSIKTLKDCKLKCKFKCGLQIVESERERVHSSFWRLGNDEKMEFYNKNVERHYKSRATTKKQNSYKKYSYFYHFIVNNVKIRVCKEFFLTTLDISQKRISYFFENFKNNDNITSSYSYRKGKHKKKTIDEALKAHIRNHINSFQKIEPHHCILNTKRWLLDGSLNLKIMYSLYQDYCKENKVDWLKEHYYRRIFNSEFSIGFTNKKNQCHFCKEKWVSEHNTLEALDNSQYFYDYLNKFKGGLS